MNPNSIKKNDMILVTRANGKEYLGKATKVGPWSKNPKITIVNYHFADEAGVMWSAKADAVKCKIAPASMLPKEPEPAAIHPIMARWSLGKTKRGPQMMEGYYFAAPVLLNGKKVGEVIDEGNGGSVMTRFKDHLLATAFEKDCTEWCKVNGADMSYLEAESEFWAWWDEARPKGKDAATFFKEQNEETAKMFPGLRPEIKQTPIHTGNLALVEGKV
jgi:hypothetical protein